MPIRFLTFLAFLICNAGAAQILTNTIPFKNTPYQAALSVDGSMIFTAGKDSTGVVWNLAGQKLQVLMGHTSSVSSISYHEDQQTILTGSYDNSAMLWNLDGEPLVTLAGHESGVINVAQTDGFLGTASRDKTAKVWDRQGNLLFTLNGHTSQVNVILFVPDKKWILTASWDGTIKIWSYEGSLIKSVSAVDSGIRSLAISLQHNLILAGHRNGTISFFDAEGVLQYVLKGHDEMVSDIEFLEGGNKFISASADATVKIWNTNGQLRSMIIAHHAWVTSLSVAGDLLVTSGDAPENMVKIWAINAFGCSNPVGEKFETLIGTWNVQTKDRTSPGNYEHNTGRSEISMLIDGCSVRESFHGVFRGAPYAREVVMIGKDSANVQLVVTDSEHGSASVLNGGISTKGFEVYWYRDPEKKRLQSTYILDIADMNHFELSSYLSTDYGETWALTHERIYQRIITD